MSLADRRFLVAIVACLLCPVAAPAAIITVSVSPPTCTSPQPLDVQITRLNGSTALVPVLIDPVLHATPAAKAAAIAAALTAAGIPAEALPTPGQLKIDGGPNLRKIDFSTGATGESADVITTPNATQATTAFTGLFEPIGPNMQPAIFTAGIVSDVGELTAQVSAQELNFQTDGPIICQALFQRLAPRAPQYGAQINYAGDRLEVYFDPAYTVTQGGIIFGTTSPSPGCAADLELPPPPPIIFGFDDPTNTSPRTFTLEITPPAAPPLGATVQVLPMPGMTAEHKRNLAAEALQTAGMSVAPVADPAMCGVHAVLPGSQVRFIDMGTGEAKDQVLGLNVESGQAIFPGHFDPFAADGQPAIFTAGIVTDVGELTAQISAQELNFQTDGPIICQALFQRLAPRAPQYGAQINYAGDRLEIYFDPAYSVTMGGVIFGTTSLSPGATGAIIINPPPPPSLPGDMNCDGVVNALDIEGFILALTDRAVYESRFPDCSYLNGDLDGDGLVTHLDMQGLLDLLIP
ncbi:MAG: hypothetical protein DCC65_06615 [Planctomycetota bacterium]|nr:MAG: hypothetical protein DCC65_06615 [Planctomycetota bacterium]